MKSQIICMWVALLPFLSLVPGCGQRIDEKRSGPITPIYEGSLGLVNEKVIGGWAWNRAVPEATVEVEIYDSDVLVGTVRADRYREDLQKAGMGDGKHGFMFPTPAAMRDGKEHTVRARIALTTIHLSKSPTKAILSSR